MRQTHDKNLQDLNNFPWENFMKQITGPVAKAFFLNWLESMAEGLLEDGRSIEDAIAEIEGNIGDFSALQQQVGEDLDVNQSIEEAIYELKQKIGSGSGDGNVFSNQFKLLQDIVHWDPAYVAAKYASNMIYTCRSSATGYPVGTGFSIIKFNYADILNSLTRISGEIKYIDNDSLRQNQLYGRNDFNGVPSSIDFVKINKTLTDQWQSFDIPIGIPKDEEPYQTNGYTLGISFSAGNTAIGPNTVIQLRNVKLFDKNDNEIPVTGTANTMYFENTAETEGTPALKGTRIQHLVLSTAGQKPTLPAAGAMPGDDNWLDTDIMKAEWCLNEADDIWYYNNGKEIKAYSSGSGEGLTPEQVSMLESFTASFSFSGIDAFPLVIGRKVRIDNITKSPSITELRVGKNGAAPTDITPQLPLTIEAADTMVFEATYNRESNSNFTLIGIKL